MKQYRYVILSSQGASFALPLKGAGTEVPASVGVLQTPWYWDSDQFYHLQRLLEEGWRPLRESGMGGASVGAGAVAFSLIVLEKDEAQG